MTSPSAQYLSTNIKVYQAFSTLHQCIQLLEGLIRLCFSPISPALLPETKWKRARKSIIRITCKFLFLSNKTMILILLFSPLVFCHLIYNFCTFYKQFIRVKYNMLCNWLSARLSFHLYVAWGASSRKASKSNRQSAKVLWCNGQHRGL